MMKGKTKAILTVVCVIALLMTSALGSLAYLTDQEQTTNAFTFGKVDITLDEAELIVGDDGSVSAGQRRVQSNDYEHCVPDSTYPKDPTVHVADNSADCYIRVFVKLNKRPEFAAIQRKHPNESFDLAGMFLGHDTGLWVCKCNPFNGGAANVTGTGDNDIVFEYWLKDAGTAGGDYMLFDEVHIPSFLDNDDAASLNDLKIDVIAQAVQAEADSYDNAEDAWSMVGSLAWPEP